MPVGGQDAGSPGQKEEGRTERVTFLARAQWAERKEPLFPVRP